MAKPKKESNTKEVHLALHGKGGRYSVPSNMAHTWYANQYTQEDWTETFLEREMYLQTVCSQVENEHGEPWSSVFDMDSISVDDDNYNECCYREVTPLEYYKDLFPPDTIEAFKSKWDAWSDAAYESFLTEVYERGRIEILPKVYVPTPIVSSNHVKKGYKETDKRGWYQRNTPLYNDYKALELTANNRFALCSMCTYLGRRKTASMAYDLRGICIDLDYVTLQNLENLFEHIRRGNIPNPTYIINSGHGVHVTYVFCKPIPLYKRLVPFLQEVKKRLTDVVWNNETSSYEDYNEHKQYQGIYQCFRMPGSWSKFDGTKNKKRTKYIIKAYKVGRRVELNELTSFLDEYMDKRHMKSAWHSKLNLDPDKDLSSETYEHLTLDQAKELYPEWYERRVVRGEEKGHWTCTEGLYLWWLDVMQRPGAVVSGHRYASMCCLFIYAIKCDIPLEDAYEDAMNLVEYFDTLTIDESNHFTPYDVECASKYYHKDYYTVSYNGKHGIKAMSGITNLDEFKTVKRNHKKQKAHLAMARIYRQDASYENVGRPSKQELVREWREQNPNGKKADCIRELQLDKKTVYRWWPQEEEEA